MAEKKNRIGKRKGTGMKGLTIKGGHKRKDSGMPEKGVRAYPRAAEDAMNTYIDLRRSQGRRPFIDAPHFEMM